MLGALGSGLWSGVFAPLGSFAFRGLLSIVTLGLAAAKDSVYRRAALGFAERASELLLAALAGGVIAIPICMLLFAMIFPRRARTLSRSLLKHVHEVGPSKDYALIGIYDEAGYVIDTHEQAGHFGDVAFRAAEANEFSPRHLCDDARKRGLAAAWRSLEIHRWQTICFGCAAQKFARCENVFLADKLIERARPHPCGERRGGVCSFNLVCSLE